MRRRCRSLAVARDARRAARARAARSRAGRPSPRASSAPPRGRALAGAALDARTEDVGGPAALPGVPGAVGGRLARHDGRQHAGAGEGAAGPGLRPGADPRLLRALLRRVRAPRAAAARGELAGVARAAAGARRGRRDRRLDAALARQRGAGAAERSRCPAPTRCPTIPSSPATCAACASSPTAGPTAVRPGAAPDAALRGPVAAGARRAAGRPRARRARSCGGCRRRGGPVLPAAPEAPPLELRDLDGRVAVLLRQLRELDDAATKRTPEQLARERYALELEAARALAGARRARTRGPPRPPSVAAASGGRRRPRLPVGRRRAPPPWRCCCSSSGDRRRSVPREAA